MSFLDRIFKRKTITAAKLVNEPMMGGFSLYGGDAYSNDVFREAVDAIARNAGKLKASHVIRYSDHERIDGDCKLNRLLQVRPNSFMTAYDLIYKTVTRLFLYNNAFVYIDRDERGNVRAFYPITASHVDILSDGAGSLFCGFMLRDGRRVTLPYDDIVHLRRFYNESEILGEDNSAIASGIELAEVQNAGVEAAIKTGASVRGILSFEQIMSPSKLKSEKEAFVADYLSMDNSGGVIAVDQKMNYQPLDHKPVLLDADQAKEIRDKIYSYLGVSEAIVSSSYTEDQYSAFYESVLEPIALQLSQEFSGKLFNDRERAFGNAIVFEAGRLQYTSNSTKVQLIAQLAPYGLLSINQALEILNLPSVPDGDRRLQALNMIDQDAALEYQLNRRPDNRLKGMKDEKDE